MKHNKTYDLRQRRRSPVDPLTLDPLNTVEHVVGHEEVGLHTPLALQELLEERVERGGLV